MGSTFDIGVVVSGASDLKALADNLGKLGPGATEAAQGLKVIAADMDKAAAASKLASMSFAEIAGSVSKARAGLAEFKAGTDAALSNIHELVFSNNNYRASFLKAFGNADVVTQMNAEFQKQVSIKGELIAIGNRAYAQMNKETAALEVQLAIKKQAYEADLKAAQIKQLNSANISSELRAQVAASMGLATSTRLITAENTKAAASAKLVSEGTKEVTEKAVASSMALRDYQGYIRGTAGALGGLWLSYGQVVPMMAAFLSASAVKNTMELGASFEYTARYIKALGDYSGESTLSVKQLQDELLKVSNVRHNINDLATGMKAFQEAGIPVATALQSIGDMSRFASLAQTELGATTKDIIAVANSYGISYSSAANKIFVAAVQSTATIKEMEDAFRNATAVGSVAGMAFNEVAAALALISNMGIVGGQAATAFTTSIIRMQTPTAKLNELFRDLGVSWSAFNSDGSKKGVLEMFKSLFDILDKLTAKDRTKVIEELFGMKGIKAAGNLINQVGGMSKAFEDLVNKIDQADKGVTALDKVTNDLGSTATVSLDKVKKAFSDSMTAAYETTPAVTDFYNKLEEIGRSQSFRNAITGIVENLFKLGNITVDTLSTIVPLVKSLTSASEGLLGLGALDLGIIGWALFKGSPGIAAIYAALSVVNNQLRDLKLPDGSSYDASIGTWASKMAASSKEFWDAVAEISAGTKGWDGKALDPVAEKARKIADEIKGLEKELSNMQAIEELSFGAMGKSADAIRDKIAALKREATMYDSWQSPQDSKYLGAFTGNTGSTTSTAAESAKANKQATLSAVAYGKALDEIKAKIADVSNISGTPFLDLTKSMESAYDKAKKFGDELIKSKNVTGSENLAGVADEVNRLASAFQDAAVKKYQLALDKSIADWNKGMEEFGNTTDKSLSEVDKGVAQINKSFSQKKDDLSKLFFNFAGPDDGTQEYANTIRLISEKLNGVEEGLDSIKQKNIEAFENKLIADQAVSIQNLTDKYGVFNAEQSRTNAINKEFDAELKKLSEKLGGAATPEAYKTAYDQITKLKEYALATDIERLKSSDSLWSGVTAGILEAQKQMEGFGKLGYDVFKDLQDGFKSIFVAGFKGGFDDIHDAWHTMLNKMLDTLINWVADVLAKNLLSSLFNGLFGDSGSGSSGLLSGLLSGITDYVTGGSSSGGGSGSGIGGWLGSTVAGKAVTSGYEYLFGSGTTAAGEGVAAGGSTAAAGEGLATGGSVAAGSTAGGSTAAAGEVSVAGFEALEGGAAAGSATAGGTAAAAGEGAAAGGTAAAGGSSAGTGSAAGGLGSSLGYGLAAVAIAGAVYLSVDGFLNALDPDYHQTAYEILNKGQYTPDKASILPDTATKISDLTDQSVFQYFHNNALRVSFDPNSLTTSIFGVNAATSGQPYGGDLNSIYGTVNQWDSERSVWDNTDLDFQQLVYEFNNLTRVSDESVDSLAKRLAIEKGFPELWDEIAAAYYLQFEGMQGTINAIGGASSVVQDFNNVVANNNSTMSVSSTVVSGAALATQSYISKVGGLNISMQQATSIYSLLAQAMNGDATAATSLIDMLVSLGLTQEQAAAIASALASSFGYLNKAAKDTYMATSSVTAGINGLSNTLSYMADGANDAVGGLRSVVDALGNIGSIAGASSSYLDNAASRAADTGTGGAVSNSGMSTSFVTYNKDGGYVGFAGGGYLTGGSYRKDDLSLGIVNGIEYRAMGGEYIINPTATEENRQELDRINRGLQPTQVAEQDQPLALYVTIDNQWILDGSVIDRRVDKHIVRRTIRGSRGEVII